MSVSDLSGFPMDIYSSQPNGETHQHCNKTVLRSNLMTDITDNVFKEADVEVIFNVIKQAGLLQVVCVRLTAF